MALRDQVISTGANSAAQLLSHAARAQPGPDRRPSTVDRAGVEAALAEAEATLERHRGELEGLEPEPREDRPPALRPGIFDRIEGHELTKRILRRALEADKPVHVLLVGPPGGGKTQFLQALASLPRSRYATGPTISSSGLFTYLLEHAEIKLLLIDEIEKGDQAELYTLYTLMESGKLTRLQHDAIEEENRIVWVMAAANSAAKLPEALRSRFVILALPAYTPEQIAEIAEAVLVKQEGLTRTRARQIARAVAARSADPRDAVQIARLTAHGEAIEPTLRAVIADKDRRAGVS